MISTLREFEEATAFERWALEALVPLPLTRPHKVKKDIAKNAVAMEISSVAVMMEVGGSRRVISVDLRPLAFGAGWKVLDLLMELAFWNSGTHQVAGKIPIQAKAQLAVGGQGVVLPLTSDPHLWRTLCGSYVATTEVRHSLIHRHARVDPSTGTLTGHDLSGVPLSPLTANEQEAFCRAVLRASDAALANRLTVRERADLAWQLDQLHLHHGLPMLCGRELQPPPLLIAPPGVNLDVPGLLASAKASFPDHVQVDVTIRLPDDNWVIAELENLPRTVLTIESSRLPPGAERWSGPGS